jgi:hypothetical protein
VNRHRPLSSICRETLAMATAVPARAVAWAAQRAGADDIGRRIKTWLDGIPTGAYLLTALLWMLVIWRGVLYPAFGGAKHLSKSWGGPTLAGAWAVHFALTIGALLVVSLAVALARRGSGRSQRSNTTLRHRPGA